ncbi:MAG: hypothetical protein QMD94_01010 [Candidatus Omnitrophota bacterium]|nr:hypothetical protein [Candidatus Omnitrophota bacterium]
MTGQKRETNPGHKYRKYIRLATVFPVQFRLVSPDGEFYLSDSIQGFTNNISSGGLCLSVNILKPELLKLFEAKTVKLDLEIELPFYKEPLFARACVAWIKNLSGNGNKCLIGLNYEQINWKQNRRFILYAWTRKLFVPVVFLIICLLAALFAINWCINLKLVKGNKALVERLLKVKEEAGTLQQKIKEIGREKENLLIEIKNLEQRIQSIRKEKLEAEKENLQAKKENLQIQILAKKSEELGAAINQLTKDKEFLKEQLISLRQKEEVVTKELSGLDTRRINLEKANFDKMYQWLKVHQNPRTGLVMSFEGDGDIANWAFAYDQALAVIAYTEFSDFQCARKILDFFDKKAKRQKGRFFNAYYVIDTEPAEYIVHSGPNIWLGIAIMQYTQKAQDHKYLALAQNIARGIIELQNQDIDGGIPGGPGVTWYSTEHNLDAYAFFNMFYKITGRQEYQNVANKILNWLIKYAYGRQDIPVKRGKGDSTIATDTYAWSIASIGPEKLEELGMSPESILDFAEKNCSVEVSYIRPEGRVVKIKGFDFAPQRHIARGGVVSSEWTAQMVIAFKKMGSFYDKKGEKDKAASCFLKADEYLSALSNMIIPSLSPTGQGQGCLPYATLDNVDTGHGWLTPKGRSTGSVAGTAYTIFAYYNYNPLELAVDR